LPIEVSAAGQLQETVAKKGWTAASFKRMLLASKILAEPCYCAAAKS
jgi:hypothetical protein